MIKNKIDCMWRAAPNSAWHYRYYIFIYSALECIWKLSTNCMCQTALSDPHYL